MKSSIHIETDDLQLKKNIKIMNQLMTATVNIIRMMMNSGQDLFNYFLTAAIPLLISNDRPFRYSSGWPAASTSICQREGRQPSWL